MKIARFSSQGTLSFGILDEDDDEFVILAGDPLYAGFDTTGERVARESVTLVAPVIPRSKIVAVGKNYREHAAEMGGETPEEPLLFLKPNTAVIGAGDAVIMPPQSERVDYEGELAVVIGKVAKNVKAENYADYVFGFTVANDVTARDLQQRDGQWSRAKGFDTFCPLGPWIETEFDETEGELRTRVNGETRQQAPLTDMVHTVPELLEYASSVFTLLPGDVILTGTPAGIGPLADGDTVEVEIDGIGALANPVRARR